MINVSNGWKTAPRICPMVGQLRKGFTLVELLVVMAILAILAGLMFPSLADARRASLRSACASSLRQLAMANHTYATAYGTFVPAASDIWSSNLHRWHGARSKTKQAFETASGPLSEYLDERGLIKRCPSFRSDEAGFEAGCGGYGYNAAGVGSQAYLRGTYQGAVLGMAPEMITQPASTVMFADAAFAETKKGVTRLIEYSFVEPYLLLADNRPVEVYPAVPSMHFRHDGRANIVWVDGHVTSEQFEHSRNSLLHEQGLGWFGPTDNSLFDPY